MSALEHVTLSGDGTIDIGVYEGDVRALIIRPENGQIPLKPGTTFVCTVVAIKREVVER